MAALAPVAVSLYLSAYMMAFVILFSGIYWGLRLITYEGGTVAEIDLIRSVYAFVVTLVVFELPMRGSVVLPCAYCLEALE